MPPPTRFWVVLIGKTATSFHAKEREDLLPTLRQLQRTQEGVSLRWFERGRVWESPEAAAGAAKLAETEAREKRTKEWRPGGEHRDPKARFEMTRDQKRAKFKRDERGGRGDEGPPSPFGPRAPREDRARRPPGDRPFADRPPRRDRPTAPPMENPFKDRPCSERPDRPRSGRPPAGRGGGFKPPRRRS